LLNLSAADHFKLSVKMSVTPAASSGNKSPNVATRLKEAAADKLDSILEFLPCCDTQVGYLFDDIHAEDATAEKLSYVGKAAYEVLRTKHPRQHHQLWNVTTGRVVGGLQYTPIHSWPATKDLLDGHDDWFPAKLAEIIKRTTKWCDIMSLGPPDGLFMTKFQDALHVLAVRSQTQKETIVVRIMFGNIVGMPVNCTEVLRELTKHLPETHKLKLWVGAWRKGTSWNHAKIIAVDGVYLWTGGHNLWDYHVSIENSSR
jgi:hypothetical protein